MKVVYVAHPLRGPTPEATEANRRRGSEISARVAWIEKVAVSNTWPMLAEHWSEEQGRELSLKIDCALIGRSDELWLCGPVQPLSPGMQVEYDHAVAKGVKVVDKRGVYQ